MRSRSFTRVHILDLRDLVAASAADILWLYIGMGGEDMDAGHPLTAAVMLDLVTTRTLIRSLALIGIEWVPVSFDEIPATSEEGLYAWAIGPTHEDVHPLDRPVGYIGIGVSKAGGVRGRLLQELRLITDSAAHAHGRAMFRLQGSPLGGPVRQVEGADLGPVEEAILASWFTNREHGVQDLKAWLSNPVLPAARRGADLLAGHLDPDGWVDAGGGRRWRQPNVSSLSRGRGKLGADPVRMLFEQVAGVTGRTARRACSAAGCAWPRWTAPRRTCRTARGTPRTSGGHLTSPGTARSRRSGG